MSLSAPQRDNRTRIFVALGVIAVILLLSWIFGQGARDNAPSSRPETYLLIIEVTSSSGMLMNVDYTVSEDGIDSSKEETDRPSIWKHQQNLTSGEYNRASVSAIVAADATVTCQISMDGKVLSRDEGIGSASCSGSSLDLR